MRQIFDIHGGIHPPERKDMSNPGWVRDCDMPSKLILPVTQHIGAPARPSLASNRSEPYHAG